MIKLTQRELEVIKLVAAGYSNPQIAKVLMISIHTVKSHLESIYFKLSVHNRVQASIHAVKQGFIE